MDMFDEALAMKGALKLSGLTQSGLAREMGVSQSYVANKLRLLSFSNGVKARIRQRGISERHARAILRLTDEDEQIALIDKVADRGLTVRECEALVDASVDIRPHEFTGIRDKRERISGFIASLKKNLDTLSSFGVENDMRTSFYGKKTYITLVIEDDF